MGGKGRADAAPVQAKDPKRAENVSHSEQHYSRQGECKVHAVHDPGMPPIGINSQARPAASPPFVKHSFGTRQMLALVKHGDNTCDHVLNLSTVHAPNLTEEETGAPARLLSQTIETDRFPPRGQNCGERDRVAVTAARPYLASRWRRAAREPTISSCLRSCGIIWPRPTTEPASRWRMRQLNKRGNSAEDKTFRIANPPPCIPGADWRIRPLAAPGSAVG